MSKLKFIIPEKSDDRSTVHKKIKKVGLKIKGSCEKGSCGKCIIKVKGAVNPPTEKDIKSLGNEAVKNGYRLACMTKTRGDATIVIPKRSRK